MNVFKTNHCNAPNVVWSKSSPRLDCIFDNLTSQYLPKQIIEIIINYDFHLEGEVDHIIDVANKGIWSSYSLPNNKMIYTCAPHAGFNFFLDTKKYANKITMVNLVDNTSTLLENIDGFGECDPYIQDISVRNKNGSYCIVTTPTSEKNTIKVWIKDPDKTEIQLLYTLTGHTEEITDLSILSDENIVVSCSNDATIRLWSLETGHCNAILSGHIYPIKQIYSTSNNKRLVSIDKDVLKIWSYETYGCLSTLNIGHNNDYIKCVGIVDRAPLGRPKVTLCQEGLIREKSMDNSHNDEFIVTSTVNDSMIKIWKVKTGENIRSMDRTNDRADNYRFSHICLDKHTGNIFEATINNKIKVWNIFDKRQEFVLSGHTDCIQYIGIMPDGKIISSSRDNTVRIWTLNQQNIDRWKKLNKCGKSHRRSFRRLNVGCTAESLVNKCKTIFLPPMFSIYSVIYYIKVLPDGRLAGYSFDGKIFIFK